MRQHYRRLETKLAMTGVDQQSWTGLDRFDRVPEFNRYLVTIPDFLVPSAFQRITAAVETMSSIERSYIPAHKKGGTIAYESIIQVAPDLASFYHAPAMRELVGRIVGLVVQPTPIHDQSSLSVLIYDRPGDHIGWHYDHNFYRGRHFTVLIPIVNSGSATGALSHARLIAKHDDAEIDIETAPNTLVLFEGARVVHKVTPIVAGERRVLLSMTYCSDPRATIAQAVARRVKDVAFFGPRALWT